MARSRSLGLLVFFCAAHAAAAPAVVVRPDLPARSAPFDGAPLLSVLPAGLAVCIVDAPNAADPAAGATREWQMVQLSQTQYAYVRSEGVRVDATSTTAARLCGGDVATGGAGRPSETAVRGGTFLPRDPFRLTLGLASGAAWLNSDVAARESIGSVGPTFYVSLGFVLWDLVAVSSSFGAAFPHDDASFQQPVMPVGGGPSMTASSTLQITNYSVAVGPRTPLLVLWPSSEGGGAAVAALFADLGWSAVGGSRSIDNCVDCRSGDLALPNGTFWRVGLDLGSTKKVRGRDAAVVLNTSYQRYIGTVGLAQEIRVGFSLWLL